jgi:hypothetical protein
MALLQLPGSLGGRFESLTACPSQEGAGELESGDWGPSGPALRRRTTNTLWTRQKRLASPAVFNDAATAAFRAWLKKRL